MRRGWRGLVRRWLGRPAGLSCFLQGLQSESRHAGLLRLVVICHAEGIVVAASLWLERHIIALWDLHLVRIGESGGSSIANALCVRTGVLVEVELLHAVVVTGVVCGEVVGSILVGEVAWIAGHVGTGCRSRRGLALVAGVSLALVGRVHRVRVTDLSVGGIARSVGHLFPLRQALLRQEVLVLGRACVPEGVFLLRGWQESA